MTVTEEIPAVTGEQIAEITCDVWGSFLDMELVPSDAEQELGGPTLTGVVHVSGAWGGSVLVETTAEHARRAAEAMFAAEPGSLSADEIGDALGELTNMVGGNIKSLVPAPSSLSLPSVAGGESYTVRLPGALLVERVALTGPAGPVRISVWKV
ncbi:MAG: chemotaxis protein CheX [Mycobacteriales bacterium]